MSLTIEEIRQVMGDLENSSLKEFHLVEENFELRLSKNDAPSVVTQVAATVPPVSHQPQANLATPDEVVEEVKHPLTQNKKTADVKAPLVGTIYLAPKPDAAPFKQVGDRVMVGEQVAIIEAMKLMTPVKSEVAGVIAEVLVANDDVVDYDKPLFRVELDD